MTPISCFNRVVVTLQVFGNQMSAQTLGSLVFGISGYPQCSYLNK